MKTQKELKDLYMEIVRSEVWPNSLTMQEYSRKKAAYIVELSSGKIICLDKPSIDTEFCFGHGMYGQTTDEEMKAASAACRRAEEDVHYFKEKNLQNIDTEIRQIQEALASDFYEVWVKPAYLGQPDDSKLVRYRILDDYESPDYDKDEPDGKGPKGMRKLERGDVKRILDGLYESRKLFEKRLNIYLKRYGLSKVTTWTYLRD